MKHVPNLFFLLISPPEWVVEDVSFLKELVRRRIGRTYRSLHSKAHLTLRQYYDFHNESLLYSFSEKISHIGSFTIHLKDFGSFKNNGTIYLTPYAPELYDLSENLNGYTITPHITIARNLASREFNFAWKIFRDRHYSIFFRCEYITVLKWMNAGWQAHTKLMLK
jgi:2'-5' RNA ligase